MVSNEIAAAFGNLEFLRRKCVAGKNIFFYYILERFELTFLKVKETIANIWQIVTDAQQTFKKVLLNFSKPRIHI